MTIEKNERTTGRPWEEPFSIEERQIYELYRRPQRDPFPWALSALLVIDVTYDFAGERLPTLEAAKLQRTACGQPAWEAIDRMADLVAAYRGAERPIVYTVAYPEEGLGGATIGGPEHSSGNRIVDAIRPHRGDFVMPKPRASAFFGTPLCTYLNRAGVQGLLVVGGTTSGCVRASVLDGSSFGFGMAVCHDACFDRSRLSHSVALFELDAKYAIVVDSGSAVKQVHGH
jgi:nicotinamidase-related amidase